MAIGLMTQLVKGHLMTCNLIQIPSSVIQSRKFTVKLYGPRIGELQLVILPFRQTKLLKLVNFAL